MKIRVESDLAASPAVCFDAARNIDLHVSSQRASGERVVAGVVHGLIGEGQEVTFEGRHFGIRWQATFRIVEFERPRRFVDEMVRGALPLFRHEHRFEANGDRTRMIDTIEYRLPAGFLGIVFDKLVFRRHLKRLLVNRARDLAIAIETGPRSQ